MGLRTRVGPTNPENAWYQSRA